MKKSIVSLYNQIEKLENRIDKIQEKCNHKNTIKKYGSSNGNYDPTWDRRWVDLICEDCDKKWRKHESKH